MSGWLYYNPDAGPEFSEQHPIRSGEVPDAENVRRATVANLKDALFAAWQVLAETEQAS